MFWNFKSMYNSKYSKYLHINIISYSSVNTLTTFSHKLLCNFGYLLTNKCTALQPAEKLKKHTWEVLLEAQILKNNLTATLSLTPSVPPGCLTWFSYLYNLSKSFWGMQIHVTALFSLLPVTVQKRPFENSIHHVLYL